MHLGLREGARLGGSPLVALGTGVPRCSSRGACDVRSGKPLEVLSREVAHGCTLCCTTALLQRRRGLFQELQGLQDVIVCALGIGVGWLQGWLLFGSFMWLVP